MKKFILAFILYLHIFQPAKSQSFSYRKADFSWPAEKPVAISVDPVFEKEDAVILDEKCLYNISGNQAPPYNYISTSGRGFYVDESSDSKSPIVQKHIRIKYLTTAGIQKHNIFALPESFDPSHDLNIVPYLKRDKIRRPRGEFECIRYFSARIWKPDGKVQPAEIQENQEVEIQPRAGRDLTFYNWIFKITNLQVGDELEMEYAYEGSFTYQPSSHLYFNSDLPKQNYQLTFRHKLKDTYMIFNHNGAAPVDTQIVQGNTMKYKDYIYREKNLKGGINESGGRPINELPYLTFYIHHLDYGQTGDNSGLVMYPLPYPWWYALSPLLGFEKDNLKLQLKKMDNSTTRMNAFFDDEIRKAADTSASTIMSVIQHTIADEFNYLDDIDFIEGSDNGLEKFGKNIENKTLRYISRLRLYEELFLRVDREYYLTILHDKRTDAINPAQYERMGSEEFCYVLPQNNQLNFYYPKSSRFGYEANELPFYYENVIAPLVPQHLPATQKKDVLPDVEFKFIRTPKSDHADNTRRTNGLVQISLDSYSANTKGKLKLSGQFSTLTRGYFLYEAKDTTISPNYYKSVLDLADAGQKATIEKDEISSVFPYNASFTYSFRKSNFVNKDKEGDYTFSLNEWFNNYVDDNFSAKNRNLNYYPDFNSEDIHRFMLQFDQPVELLDAGEYNDTIANGFAHYIRHIEQKDPQNILIESTLIVHSEIVPAQNAGDVQTVYDAIRNWNKRTYRVRKL